MNRVYLDWNATAPLRREAREAMLAATEIVGNPSSVHAEGRAAKSALERAREEIATALGAEGQDVIFTSGATEAAARFSPGAIWPVRRSNMMRCWHGAGTSWPPMAPGGSACPIRQGQRSNWPIAKPE